ncbi:hypothetical protein JCM12296A_47980 [Desulfosarcina cetonica]
MTGCGQAYRAPQTAAEKTQWKAWAPKQIAHFPGGRDQIRRPAFQGGIGLKIALTVTATSMIKTEIGESDRSAVIR